MFMHRTFLPVGQGAFYLERFFISGQEQPINVAYDCGSLSGTDIVKKVIHHWFDEKEEISAVFLSHLHEDHVNGLPELMTHCRVNTIYYPLIEMMDIPLLQLQNRVNGLNENSVSQRILQALSEDNSRLLPGNETKWIAVQKADSTSDIPEKGSGLFPQTLEKLTGRPLPNQDNNWIFAPFNFHMQSHIDALKDELCASFGLNRTELTNTKLSELWQSEEARKTITQAYKSVLGEFNTNSMTLFSGRSSNVGCQIETCRCPCPLPLHCCESFYFHHEWFHHWLKRSQKAAGCLYTGDYNAHGAAPWNALKQHYSSYWDSIGCVQIPHHGGRLNYNAEFCDFDAIFAVSAGLGNSYGHPNGDVLASLRENGRPVSVITQDPQSVFSTVVC